MTALERQHKYGNVNCHLFSQNQKPEKVNLSATFLLQDAWISKIHFSTRRLIMQDIGILHFYQIIQNKVSKGEARCKQKLTTNLKSTSESPSELVCL